jgi:hypothetical protein
MRTLSILFVLALLFTACQNSSTESSTEETTTPTEEVQETNTSKQYTLTPFEPSASFPGATLSDVKYKGKAFDFEVSNYELGEQTEDAPQKMCANSAQGQHIHLIIDNEPYAAKYTSSFAYDLDEGQHYMLAFLSRSYHESIKTKEAHLAKKIEIIEGYLADSEDITEPMLFYSRPKGTYVGEKDTKKVMLDFYLVNADLGTDYMVKAEINGEEHMIDSWQPYYIEGLPMGENTITLTLVDADGKKVNTPLNPVTRVFTLAADPAEES